MMVVGGVLGLVVLGAIAISVWLYNGPRDPNADREDEASKKN